MPVRSRRLSAVLTGQHRTLPADSSRHRAVRKKRIFRHAEEIFRELRAGCAALPMLRSTDAFGAKNAPVRRIARPV
jgi:hypothetical protein